MWRRRRSVRRGPRSQTRDRTTVELGKVYERCAHLVDGLTLPHPFDVTAFVTGITDRPVHLLPVNTAVAGVCGLLIRTRNADYICYEQGTSRVHRDHIVLHEAAHLLMGHTSQVGDLMPELDLTRVGQVLGRSGYSDQQEQEAEIVASLIAARIGAPVPAPRDSIAGRLEASLDS